MTAITITVAVQPGTNLVFGIVEGSGHAAEAAAREDAKEWYGDRVETLDVVTIPWVGPIPTEHSDALGRAVENAPIGARRLGAGAVQTYRIDTSEDAEASPASSRQGLWVPAPGEAEGWDDLDRAIAAAEHLLEDDGFPQVASVRVVSEQTGEIMHSL